MAHPIDVGQGEPGVIEGGQDHGHLERPAGPLELAGRRDVVGHPHDGRRPAQRAVDPLMPRIASVVRPSARLDQAFLGSSENGVTRSLLGSLGSPSTRSPMMLRCTWSVPP